MDISYEEQGEKSEEKTQSPKMQRQATVPQNKPRIRTMPKRKRLLLQRKTKGKRLLLLRRTKGKRLLLQRRPPQRKRKRQKMRPQRSSATIDCFTVPLWSFKLKDHPSYYYKY